MCGIFGFIGSNDNSAKIVLSGLKNLEYRGYDSWGIAVLNPLTDEISVKKRTGKIGDAKIDDLPKSDFGFGHTRWATHGGVTQINAHPHLDCTRTLAIIHNGIMENFAEIKEELINKGHKFISETDTEVIVHLIEENKKKYPLSEAVRISFNKLTGLNAIIVMDAGSKTFVAAKNGSPLVIGKGKDLNLIASDAHALLPYTKDIYFINDGELVVVSNKNIKVINVKTDKAQQIKFQRINWKEDFASKKNFPHFMLKEIYDQPDIIENIANTGVDKIKKFAQKIKNSNGSYLIGCGTAAYACLAGTYLFSKITKKHVNYSVASEFGYSLDFLNEKSLVIALSQSGETIDVLDAVKKTKNKKASVGSFVNVLGSTLYRISDLTLLLDAGVEKAVVSTKAFTAKISYLLLLASFISNQTEIARKSLIKSANIIRKILTDDYKARILNLIKIIKNKEHIYVIGRGVSYPIALETALKIKEASYIHAEGFAAGELKHGVIALIEKGTPCIAFLPNDDTYGANLAGAMEMKARGGYIIGISYKPHEVFDYYLPVSDSGISSLIPSAVVGQLLGYYLSLARGLNPDMPRNLAKSVTVK